MKRKLLPVAIGAAIAFAGQTSANAAADVTIYGKFNYTAQQIEATSYYPATLPSGNPQLSTPGKYTVDDQWELLSNASRLGFKGMVDIAGGLGAIWKIELQVIAAGDKSKEPFTERNIYAGLKGDAWGSLIAGRNDTPTKMSQKKIDLFNDLFIGDIKYVLVGENRMNNILMYSTPEFNGFGANLMTIFGEEEDVDDDSKSGLTDAFSGSVYWANDDAYVALAGDSNVNNTDIVRTVGQLSLGDFTVGGVYQWAQPYNSEGGTAGVEVLKKPFETALDLGIDANGGISLLDSVREQQAWLLSAKYNVDSWTFKTQYVQSDNIIFRQSVASRPSFSDAQVSLGADYQLVKGVKLFGYVSENKVQDDKGVLGGNTKYTTGALGLEVKF